MRVQRLTLQSLARVEERYRLLFEHNLGGIIVVDNKLNSNVLMANSSARAMLGYNHADLQKSGKDSIVNFSELQPRIIADMREIMAFLREKFGLSVLMAVRKS